MTVQSAIHYDRKLMSKNKFSTIKSFFLKHRFEVLLLVVLLLIAGFLRLYRIGESLQFLGDQGRDALLVARIFKQADPVFIGPVTSIGNMYLGPLYYYFMLPWLWLSYPSPVGPAVAVAILGTLTVLVVYLFGREIFGKRAAGIAAFLVTINAVAIAHSRFSWNPNPEPLVATLMMWAIYRAVTKSSLYWIGVSICFAILTQLHYMALLTLVPAGLVWLYQLVKLYWSKRSGRAVTKEGFEIADSRLLRDRQVRNDDKKAIDSSEMLKQVRHDGGRDKRTFWVATILSIGIFLLSLMPLVLFDLKHGGVNLRAFQDLMGGQNAISQPTGEGLEKIGSILQATHGRSLYIFLDTQIGADWNRNTLFLLGLMAVTIFALYRDRRRLPKGLWLIALWIGVTILGTSAYSHSIYDHYILFALPAVWLFFGWLLASLSRLHLLVAVTVGLLLLAIASYNLQKLSFNAAGPTLSNLRSVAQTTTDRLQPGERYNIVLLSESRDLYGQHYRFFFDTIKGKEPINPEHDSTTEVDTLIIINEEHATEDVLSLPIYEIQAFGQAKSLDSFEAAGNVTVTILRK